MTQNQPLAQPADSDATPRRIEQKRFGQRTRFALRRDDFEYELTSGGSTRSWRMEYADLSRERERLVDRNTWWRNVGLIWLALGVLFSAMAYAEMQTLRISMWVWIGLICCAVYRLRVIRWQIIPAQRCNVMVIDNARGDEIVAELERRRARQLRERYDYLSPHEHPEQQRRRIEWLRQQGVLDGNEVSARLLQLDTMAAVQGIGQATGDESDD